MKILKKLVSCLMAGIIAFTAAVCMSAGALPASAAGRERYTVTGGYNEDGTFSVCIGGFPKWALDGLYGDIKRGGSRLSLMISVKFDDLELSTFYYFKEAIAGTAFSINEKKVESKIVEEYFSEDASDYRYTLVILGTNPCIENMVNTKKAIVNVNAIYSIDGEMKNYYITPEGLALSETPYEVNTEWTSLPEEEESEKRTDISTLKFNKISNQEYTGDHVNPKVTIKDGKKTLKKGRDYSVGYDTNIKVGIGTISITGKGNYTGSKIIKFSIVPAKTKLKVSTGSGKIKFTWKETKRAERYEIYYSRNGGSYKKLETVAGNKTSYSTEKLDYKNNSYKFKIRSYAVVDGKKYYSSFSKEVKL